MTITRKLMKPGKFNVSLKPGTPKTVMQQIAAFDHVVVTRTRLLPVEAYSDANLLAQSLYTGVIEELSRTGNSMSGYGLEYWLGTPDGRGDLLDTAVSRTAGTLSQWVGDLRPSSLAAGTVTNTGTSTVTNSLQGVTRREALSAICRAAGAEWRVNPDFTLDAATAANLFVTAAPSLVITRRPGGPDGQFRSVEISELSTSESVGTYVTEAIVLGDGLVAATSAGSTSYKDGLNNNVVMQALVSAPRDESASAAAAAVIAERNSLRRELTLSSRSYNVTRFVDPGDTVYVWDEQAGLSNQSNQITYEGRLITPIALRVYSVTFPLEEGMGVYARRSGSTPVWTDLTDWVQWENSPVRWEVGAANLPGSQDIAGAAYLGANREIVQRLSSPGGYIAGATATASTYTNATSSETDVTASSGAAPSLTLTLSTSRRYKMIFSGRFATTSAGDSVIVRLLEGGTQRKAAVCPLPVASLGTSIHLEWPFVPASGSSVTYKVAAARQSGAGTISAVASSQTPLDFWIEDIGPA